jgi:hypothetical protein
MFALAQEPGGGTLGNFSSILVLLLVFVVKLACFGMFVAFIVAVAWFTWRQLNDMARPAVPTRPAVPEPMKTKDT